MKYTRELLFTILLLMVIVLTDSLFPQQFIRRNLDRFISPLQQIVYTSGLKGIRFVDFIFTFDDVYRENETLKDQLREQFAIQTENGRLKEENSLLRNQLKVNLNNVEPQLTAPVLGLDTSGTDTYMIIGLGSDDGVSLDMVAILDSNLIGKVVSVTSHRSKIIPVTAVSNKIPVRIVNDQGNTLTDGLIQGNFNVAIELIQLANSEASIHQGDRIYTSGIDGIYPEGLFVGTVESVQTDQSNTFKIARIQYYWKFSTVHTVFLVHAVNPS
ncbi:rod shape-determining protein MreC [candidate division WWE3 bacterium]|uniref:Cell shape-determining protein MreC n=1 Tax=candidate division WWE3 bacterium TaxID=2053526 RepID=A0A955LGM3_UNCKA|nr:rod shape-determining protein MreC [candidate division WWE3 bacterium]